MELRPYQHAAVWGNDEWPGIVPSFRQHESAMAALCTGSGKTPLAAFVANLALQKDRRVALLAHRTELLTQARRRFLDFSSAGHLDIGIEKAGDFAGDHHRVVLGSVQSLRGERLDRFDASEFGLVVVDEAHHGTAATNRRIIEHFAAGGAKILGLTATPYRLDGGDLTELFGVLAFEYGLADAVADGWAVPPLSIEVLDAVDLRQVEHRGKRGDFVIGQLQTAMTEAPVIARTAKAALELCEGRQTIIFTAGLEQNEALARYLNDARPGCAVTVDGTMKEDRRRHAFGRYERCSAQFLINVDIATEGYDNPATSSIMVARPTRSLGLYMQMIGRGSRLLGATMEESKANGKADFLIVDMVGVTGDDSELTASKALGEGMAHGAVRRARKKAAEEPVAVLANLELAAAEEERESARRRELERAQYKTRRTNPLAILGIVPEYGTGGRPASQGQLEFLARHGIKEAQSQLEGGREVFSADLARTVQKRIHHRRKDGLCTPRMAVQLEKRGINGDVPFEVAKEAMDAFAAAGWRPDRAALEAIQRKVEAALAR